MIIGVIILAVGAFTYNYVPSADAALAAQCQAAIAKRGADVIAMADRCGEKAFASAMTATDAGRAAQSIAGANQSEVLVHTLSNFCIGLGGVLTIIGVLGMLGVVRRVRPGKPDFH